jgi:hypothetical protein
VGNSCDVGRARWRQGVITGVLPAILAYGHDDLGLHPHRGVGHTGTSRPRRSQSGLASTASDPARLLRLLERATLGPTAPRARLADGTSPPQAHRLLPGQGERPATSPPRRPLAAGGRARQPAAAPSEQPETGAAFWFRAGGGLEDGGDPRAAALRGRRGNRSGRLGTGPRGLAPPPRVQLARDRLCPARAPVPRTRHALPGGSGVMTDSETTDLTASRWWSVDELVPRDLASRLRALLVEGDVDPGRRRRLSSGRPATTRSDHRFAWESAQSETATSALRAWCCAERINA